MCIRDRDLSGMVAGSKYRGEFEERIKKVIAEVVESKDVLLFIDEIHTIIGAGEMCIRDSSFTVMEPDASVQVPEGLTETKITIDGHAVKGWVWGNETEHQYCVIYAMNLSLIHI